MQGCKVARLQDFLLFPWKFHKKFLNLQLNKATIKAITATTNAIAMITLLRVFIRSYLLIDYNAWLKENAKGL